MLRFVTTPLRRNLNLILQTHSFISRRFYSIKSIHIGDTKLRLFQPQRKEFVPSVHVTNIENFVSQLDQETLKCLRWMAQKDALSQDMFLIGHPGDMRRKIAFLYCELTRREVEYIAITRDTSEHDFKQRREIESGNAFYVDQAAVRAALYGRVLILDGIEKAEQNILPVINNLLENREMALEDGRTLISNERYQALLKTHTKAQLDMLKIFPVHPDFRVIALGLPVQLYRGNPLDPPLRSRFQALKVGIPSIETCYEQLVNSYPNIPRDFIKVLLQFSQVFTKMDIHVLPFSITHMKNLLEILEKFKPVMTEKNIQRLIEAIYPYTKIFETQPHLLKVINNALKNFISKCDSYCQKAESSHVTKVERIPNTNRALVYFNNFKFEVIAGDSNTPLGFTNDTIKIHHQLEILSNMIQSHSIGRDICIVGPPAVGKSVICRNFASLLGYKVHYFPMYAEMTTRDLLQRRITDENGNTKWKDSPLIEAMKLGYCCIMDGVHRLSADILLSLQQLVQDRMLYLFDGSRYIHHEQYDELRKTFSKEDLDKKKVYRIHPSFRIIAIGISPSEDRQWLTPEVNTLFHFYFLDKLPVESEKELLLKSTQAEEKLVDKLLKFKTVYNTESTKKQLTIRDVLRILKRKKQFPNESIYECLQRATMVYFLPNDHKEFFNKAAHKLGITPIVKNEESVELSVKDNILRIGDIETNIVQAKNPALIPRPYFVATKQHLLVLKEMLKDHILQQHTLLIGNQGVGKNKLADYFLQMINMEREYMQLHRDTTIHSLTVQPTVDHGVLMYTDSPLVRAVQHGRVLMLDEADKAPLEVISIIKSLIEDGEMVLSDGRRIVRKATNSNDIQIHKNFRMIVLANRPGFPFQGNDFFRECGDLFSAHFVQNPQGENEIKMLQAYGPSIPHQIIVTLSQCFDELRQMVEMGTIQYPYSTRELVNVIKHLEKFPNDGLTTALQNVIAFDSFEEQTMNLLKGVFEKYGIPLDIGGNFGIKLSTELPIDFTLSHNITSQAIGELTPHSFTITAQSAIPEKYWFDEPTSFATTQSAKKTSQRVKHFSEWISSIDLPSNAYTFTSLKDSSVHILTYPFTLLSYHQGLDNYSTTDLYIYRSMFGESIPKMISLKQLDMILLMGQLEYSQRNPFLSRYRNENLLVFLLLHPYEYKHRYALKLDMDALATELGLKNSSKIEILNEFSDESSLITLYSNHMIATLDFSNVLKNSSGSCTLNVIKIPQEIEKVFWIHPTEYVLQDVKGNLYHLIKNHGKYSLFQWENSPNMKISNLYRKFKNSSSEQLCLGTSTKQEILQLSFSADKISMYKTTLAENFQKSLFAYKTKQLVAIESSPSCMHVVHPTRKTIRTIDMKTKRPLQATELENGNLAVLHEETINIYDLDIEKLIAESKYWSQFISTKKEKLRLSIEYENTNVAKGPKHGIDDDQPHVGGNTYAGGTGGSDTAGLGGKGGPYRLDKGFPVYQISDAEKQKVSEEVKRKAREMAQQAYKERLKQIQMSDQDMKTYVKFYENVKSQIVQLREILSSLKAKEQEQVWIKNLPNGELDDNKIVEGITGEKLIYKKRGKPTNKIDSTVQKKPKALHFVMDVSGSMYRFNSQDERLYRMMECAVLIMESLKGFEYKFSYTISGHSGETEYLEFVSKNNIPQNEMERLRVLLRMHAHSQFCMSGDSTIEATKRAIQQMAKQDADERFVFVFSDANLQRYGIPPESLGRALMSQEKQVKAFVIFIASFDNEAQQLIERLPPGRAYACFDTGKLPQVFKQIFASNVLE